MKALVLVPQPFFSPRGTPFSVYYRTLITSELSVQVDLLTYGQGQDVDIPGVHIIRIPRFGFLGSIKVGPSYQKLYLDIFIAFWAIMLLLKKRYDFVHAHEEAVFICRFLKPIFRFKMVYDMHSSLPQQLTNFQFTRSRFLIGLFKKLEDSCLRAADAIITICPDLFEYVNGLIRDQKKHVMIENSIFDAVQLTHRSQISKRHSSATQNSVQKSQELPKGGRFVVYAGTLEPYQGIDRLLKAFKKVAIKIQNVYLIISGGSKEQVKFYCRMSENLGLNGRIFFTGHVPQHMAKYYASLASVLVSPRIQGANTPLKIYEQIASGIPLVATRTRSHIQVLDDDVAFLVKTEPVDLARGIIEALKSNGNCRRITGNAKRLYEQKYSRPVYIKKMQQVLELLF